jgi:hypothetical protein
MSVHSSTVITDFLLTVQNYQTPYTSSPYGPGMPNAAGGPSMQQPYIAPTSNASFGMNTGNMTPQHAQQRTQPGPVATPIPSNLRVSPYGNAQHSTPPQAQAQQQYYMTPPNPVSNQTQQIKTPLSAQSQTAAQNILAQSQHTPQTPNFPPNSTGGANASLASPLSPGSEAREKERVTLLLDINRELLLEVMRLQAVQAEAKKEAATPSTDAQGGDSKPAERPNPAATGKDYVE